MSKEHFDDFDLLAYLDTNRDIVDVDEVKAHLSICIECRARTDNLRVFTALLADKDVQSFSRRKMHGPSPRHLRSAAWNARRSAAGNNGDGNAVADLTARPIETWSDYLNGHPSIRTSCLIARFIRAAREEFDRDAERALGILRAATTIADAFQDPHIIAEHRANIAKENSNALRMLGRYRDALAALDQAELFLRHLPAPEYDLTFIRWARATVLFCMTEYATALPMARSVIDTFVAFGETYYACQAEILIANIICEQGNVPVAHAIYVRLLSYFSGRDAELVARLNANLAECEVRLDHPEAARAFAADAMRGYEDLDKPAEKIRVRWTLGYSLLRQGRHAEAVEELKATIGDFEAMGMTGETGAAGLDLAEAHISRGEWDEAERLSRHLVDVFTETHSPIHKTRALAFLRDSTIARTATVELVEYLRQYLETAPPDHPFAPPAIRPF